MFRPSLRRIASLALCAVLAGSATLSAKPLATVSPDSAAVSQGLSEAGFWNTVWSFLVSVWTKTGSSPDPYGGASNGQGPTQPEADTGSAGDPYGLPGH